MRGLGRRADWLRNVTAGGALAVQIGNARFSPDVRVLGTGEAAAVLCDYLPSRASSAKAPVPMPNTSARGPGRQGYGRASYTMLNGVWATRRKLVKPPALMTSPIVASPACAPSASPSSCDSDAGVHSSVENP